MRNRKCGDTSTPVSASFTRLLEGVALAAREAVELHQAVDLVVRRRAGGRRGWRSGRSTRGRMPPRSAGLPAGFLKNTRR